MTNPQRRFRQSIVQTYAVYLSEILSFRTLSIVLVIEKQNKKHDVSETASVSVLR
jgi:hypothetical protein